MKNKTRQIFTSLTMMLLIAAMLTGSGSRASSMPAETTPEEILAATERVSEGADLVLKNGTIQTMVGDETAEAVAVKGGVIVYVGDNEGVKPYIGKGTNVIDLDGKYVTPGFIDGHNHGAGHQLSMMYDLYLLETEPSIEAYHEVMREYMEEHPDATVVKGVGMDLNAFPNAMPTHEFIDKVISDRPVVISDISTHGALLNTSAMEAIGLTSETPDPKGGTIYKDEHGEPTGYVSDCSMLTDPLTEGQGYTVDQYHEAFLRFQADMSSYGLTSVQIPGGTLPETEAWKMFDDMASDGELNLRVSLAAWAAWGTSDFSIDTAEATVVLLDEAQKYISDFQNITLIKTIIDGVPEGKSAYLLEPYAPEAGMAPDYCGPQYCSQETLNAFVAAIDKAGYQIEIHAMGDAGVHAVLNAFEYAQQQNGRRDSRHQIAHVTLITDEDKARMGELGVIGAMQPLWFYYDPFFSPLEEQVFGTERFNSEYHIRDMVNHGIIITGSIDYPVLLDARPLNGIEVGVTQCSPYPGEDTNPAYVRNADQGVTPMEALQWYTINGAKAMFMEDKIGSIEVGKKADMVVLGYSILKCAAQEISEAPIIYTISDGRIVYESESAK